MMDTSSEMHNSGDLAVIMIEQDIIPPTKEKSLTLPMQESNRARGGGEN